ncbi:MULTISPECIES: NUDIX domain-containing protein [unclassified Thermosipho (in: thermotogales)]|uniref:NUDIX domain-containing protein n=1 Tax=unclassified Thermosipho (in: thermotogales) TaxID=2676525 RepID=UPI0009846FBF|nr:MULTISPECIES: NUDIX domain-containing protein [unclassified Thermosipho (in: thermotogales)]MBT1247224.1 DNA mismatch repair protein MutT [Thermosipho sp. 1244]OOC47205.1 DNA mismatch repair protein MutT [Thermosipho sp. 1223]
MYENEKVLVIPTKEVEKLCNKKTGLIKVPEYDIISIIKEYGKFVDRNTAENDEAIRQVIPYIILRENNKFLLFKRTTAQGEKRLHNKITIGVGGHINTEDSVDPIEALKKGMLREINEEVDVEIKNIEYLGLINVTDNPVSRVHVGLCYIADVKYFGLKEKEKFIEIFSNNPGKYFEEMEGWSKVVVQSLDHMQK